MISKHINYLTEGDHEGISEYDVYRSYARKLWMPYNGFRLTPPRLKQLLSLLHCHLHGHKWSEWTTDDEEGPLGVEQGYTFPLFRRPARRGEFAIRVCRNNCGAIERRVPIVAGKPRIDERG